jgi:hypothetical protein
MSSADRPPTFRDRNPTAMELITDHRARLALEEEERLTQRSRQFEELRAEFNSVSVRIRAWEKMHGLCLPTNPAHPILDVIASVTGIPLTALREEQRTRRSMRATPPAPRREVTDG